MCAVIQRIVTTFGKLAPSISVCVAWKHETLDHILVSFGTIFVVFIIIMDIYSAKRYSP